ncbi:hypothetical protein PR048_000769 [Dryococelus australis]|uniref:DDE Tnp4 domain-containing protein n=1 Tax=Dryococelus australis TaxID=614101 RepID=A0ABQ9IFK3_9NEOP|nr:hypothetical protein PR048_000769 [Dryococelus australis]
MRDEWVHNINNNRTKCGEYHTVYPDLIEDDVKFFQYFRVTEAKFTALFDILREELEKQTTKFREQLPKYKLQSIVMPTPDEQLWASSEEMFRTKLNFSNVVAVLDGKHVLIQAPPHMLLTLVDANYKFLAVGVGAFGKNSDANIFSNSAIGKGLSEGNFNLPPPKPLPGEITNIPHVIIGDEDSPLRTYLMRPYSRDDVKLDVEKKILNYRLSRARNTVENTFGILAPRFRIFQRKSTMSHEHVVLTVLSACCLHNLLRDDTCYWTEFDCQMSLCDMKALQSLRGIGSNYRHNALQIRDYLSNTSTQIEDQLTGNELKCEQENTDTCKTMAPWLDYSPPTKVNRVRFPPGSPPDFRMWESCRGSPVYLPLAIRCAASYSARFTPIVSPAIAFQRERERERERKSMCVFNDGMRVGGRDETNGEEIFAGDRRHQNTEGEEGGGHESRTVMCERIKNYEGGNWRALAAKLQTECGAVLKEPVDHSLGKSSCRAGACRLHNLPPVCNYRSGGVLRLPHNLAA